MRHLSRLLCVVLAVLACSTLARAEEGFLSVLVLDPLDRPIPGVTLSVSGSSGKGKTNGEGKARIGLNKDTKANDWVYLIVSQPMPLDPVKNTPLDLVFIAPHRGYTPIPPFDLENKNFVMIVLCERSSRLLLEYGNGDVGKALISSFNAKAGSVPSNPQMTPEERKNSILTEVGKEFGLPPADVDRAIRQWVARVKDKHDEGLAKFYQDDIEEARKAFTASKEERKKAIELANASYAESAFYEGKSYFRQAKYGDAIASYKEALSYRPNDTTILTDLAQALEITGQSEQAEPLLKQALEINEETFGQLHEEVADSLAALGALYINRSDYKQGVAFFERMVSTREKVKGLDDPRVAHDLNNLAVGYMALGKIAEAEERLKRALAILEKTAGPESPSLAFTLNTIGSLYDTKGNTLDAERFLKRAIEIMRKTFEKSQNKEKDKKRWATDYAQSVGFLGNIYLGQGRFARAEPLLKEALEYEEISGTLRPSDIKRIDALADLYERLGNFTAARKLYARSLEILENALGKEHLQLTGTILDLALVYEAKKKFADAEGLRMRVLKIAEKNGPATEARAMLSLARFYERQKKYTEAEDYHKRALAQAEKAEGQNPAVVISFINILARYYERRDNFAASEPHRKRILSIIEQARDAKPSDIAAAFNMMAQFYELQKKYAEAEGYYKRAEDVVEKAYGKDDLALISPLDNRADLYETQERVSEAEQLYKRAVEITSKSGVPEYPNKVSTLNDLANFYRRQKRYGEAEQFYRQAQTIIESAKEVEPQDKLAVLFNMARLLEDQKKYAEAKAVYNQFLSVIEKENGPDYPGVARLREKLGAIAKQQGENVEAEDNYKRALSIFENEVGPEDPEVATCLEGYAALLRSLTRDPEAAAMESRAKKIRDRLKQVREDEN